MNQWLFLSVAIVSEVIATSALKSSNGFTQLWPSLVVVAGWRCVLFSIAGFAYHTGGNRLRNLVRRGHRAYNSRRLAYAGTIPRRARYPRIGAYRCWGGRPERILEDNG